MDYFLSTKIGGRVGPKKLQHMENSALPKIHLATSLRLGISVGIRWHKHHHLHSASFWATEAKNSDSASWESIISLKPLATIFLKCSIKNGETALFWYDLWTPFWQLIEFIGQAGQRDLNVPINATVREASSEMVWRLSSPRSDMALTFQIHLTTLPLPHLQSARNTYHWIADNPDCHGYFSSKTWEVLRPRVSPKQWTKAVWFSGAIPCQAFNMWLASLNRLPTKVCLASWGLNIHTNCCFCTSPPTVSHLG
ncbi:uncharacterized protein LOC106358439 [Brassica napus]|uniref:uncharacterized protein LOC106358439 n=1 Tax=Brassica napus TaxID=3708 RepID=UPI0006AA9D5A|nr:uncharacterized protein LOC106358439 [Brassica napus]